MEGNTLKIYVFDVISINERYPREQALEIKTSISSRFGNTRVVLADYDKRWAPIMPRSPSSMLSSMMVSAA